MKKWDYTAVLGDSNLFRHHFTKCLNDQTSNPMFIYLQRLARQQKLNFTSYPFFIRVHPPSLVPA